MTHSILFFFSEESRVFSKYIGGWIYNKLKIEGVQRDYQKIEVESVTV
jgi:hypothetical protein